MTEAGAGGLRLTVGILSHKRPHLLSRVLAALGQQDIAGFEVVVAGDLPHLEEFDLPDRLADGIRYVHVTEPNVCHARNLVVAAAGGDVIAFCDDDAVAEPDWLRRIAEPFANPKVAAVGGLVRARDGITVEWRGATFDRSGRETPFDPPPGIHVIGSAEQLATGRFGGLMGANSAFRRAAVVAVGGFDEAYRYFLDETDIALRLAEAGWDMAFTDAAEVHHLREANSVRGHLKKPRNLTEVAASKAYFCTRHLDPASIAPEFDRFRARRHADCDGLIRIGAMRGAERHRLLAQVDAGLSEGCDRRPRWFDGAWARPAHRAWPAAADKARGYAIALYCGWGFGRARRLVRLGMRLAEAGHRVSVFRYQSGFAARRVGFRNGVWVHEGGTWRFDHRDGHRLQILRRMRTKAEMIRMGPRRSFDFMLAPASGKDDAKIRLPRLPDLSLTLLSPAVNIDSALAHIAADLDADVVRPDPGMPQAAPARAPDTRVTSVQN